MFKTSPRTINSNFVFKNCLFGAIKLAKLQILILINGYGIGFDSKEELTFTDEGSVKNVIIFGIDLSNSRHATNKTQSALILGHGLTQKINDTTIMQRRFIHLILLLITKFCLSLHYNGGNSYLFVNGKQFINFKAKNPEPIKYPMFLGSLSKDYDKNSPKDTELYGDVYDFSVDYSAIKNDEILDIHNYLMKKNNIG